MIVDTLDRHDPRRFGLSGLFTLGAGGGEKNGFPATASGEERKGRPPNDIRLIGRMVYKAVDFLKKFVRQYDNKQLRG
jgi:hypothetical protein